MRVADRARLWAATHVSHVEDGATVEGYVNLRFVAVDAQIMSAGWEQKIYGEVSGGVLTLRAKVPPNVAEGDHIYLSEPEKIGQYGSGEDARADYGPGDYSVVSVRSVRPGGARLRNPTVITARRVAK